MRIGILTQYYPPEMGAPQARLAQLAQRLAAAGDEVFVLTAMPSYPAGRIFEGYGGWWQRSTDTGVTVLRTWAYPTCSVRKLPRLWNYFSFVLSSLIYGVFALPRLDFLLTESPPLFLGISGWALSRVCRARWIFNVSDLWPESAVRLGFVRDGLALRTAQALEAFCYRKAWLITGQSKEILADIGRRYPAKALYHLSNGVDSELFRPAPRSGGPQAGVANECVAMYAGLHGVAQGLAQILDAAALLEAERHIRFILVGDGPEKSALMADARRRQLTNVTFLDSCRHSEMPRLLAGSDIAVIPLRTRLPGAVPSKIYEAMAAAVPIVLVAEGEAADIVRSAECGIAVQPGDAIALANAIRLLAESPQRRQDLGRSGRRAACERFDRSAIVARFRERLDQEYRRSPGRTGALLGAVTTVLERLISAVALVILAPLMVVIALAILFEDGFPIFFRQQRVGRFGRLFSIVKFRTMSRNRPGRAITVGGDARITGWGRHLRRYKLDELPQLWNVLRGEMSLVGPRPELPQYVDASNPEWQAVLSARPGITCVSSVRYRDEESLLAAMDDPETYYRQTLLPDKLHLSADYLRRRTIFSDISLILSTILSALRPPVHQPRKLEQRWP